MKEEKKKKINSTTYKESMNSFLASDLKHSVYTD